MSRTARVVASALTLSFVLAALGVPSGETPAGAAQSGVGELRIGQFDLATDPWNRTATEGSTVRRLVTHEGPYQGKGAARITTQIPEAGGDAEMFRDLPAIDATGLRFAARSSDIDELVLRLTDDTGQVHFQSVPVESDGEWHLITRTVEDLVDGPNSGHYGGDDDGVWHGPARQLSFLVGATGTIDIDDVVLSTKLPGIAVAPEVTGNVFSPGDDVRFGYATEAASLAWTVRNAQGARVTDGRRAKPTPDGTISLGQLPTGWYEVTLTGTLPGGETVTNGTDLAVLPDTARRDRRLGTSAHYENQQWSFASLPLVARAGLGFTRDGIGWDSVETVETGKGNFAWPETIAEYQRQSRTNDLQMYDIILYGNELYHEGEAPATQQGRDGFAAFSDESIKKYGTDDTTYEIWNEWNWRDLDGPAKGTAENYAALLDDAATRIRAQHPDATISGPAMALTNDWQGWVDDFIASGGLDDLDAFTTHPYNFTAEPEQVAEHVAYLRAKLDAAGHPDMPIWFSEAGWHTASDPAGASEPDHARNLVRAELAALAAGADRYTVYDFQDDGEDATEPEHRFGMLRSEASTRGALVPKPGYVAQSILTRQTADRAVTGTLDLGDNRYGVTFAGRDADAGMTALWATSAQTWSVAASGPVQVLTMYGESAELIPDSNGKVHISVGSDPVYLTGDLGAVTTSSPYGLTAPKAFSQTPAEGVWHVDAGAAKRPLTLQVGNRKVVARASSSAQDISVRLPASAEGPRTWSAQVLQGGHPSGFLTATAQVRAPLTVTGGHALTADGSDVLRLVVTNATDEPRTVTSLDWELAGATGSDLAGHELAGGEQVVVDVPVTAFGAWRAQVDGDTTDTDSGVLVEAEQVTDVPFGTVTVDGTIDPEIAERTGITLGADEQSGSGWTGEDDQSGTLWLSHDDDNLYVSAVIRDDVHAQPARGSSIWEGDGLQLGVTPGWPGEGRQPVTEIGTALSDAGTVEVARWLPGGASTEGVAADVRRDESRKETTYEFAVPWSQNGADPSDGVLATTLVFNENDGPTRTGWLAWGAGVADSKDPSLFRALRLLPE